MSLEMVIGTPAPMGFSPVQPSNRAVGPSSNTGQKSTLTAPIIDFCVVVIDSEKAKKLTRKLPLGDLVRYVFGTGSAIVVGPIQDRVFNFYPRSATMVDETGSVCGKIGLDDDGKVCISLSGQGCQHVRSWPQVANVLDDLDARISHVDIAIDDLTGETFNLQTFRDFYDRGEFVMNGRPPQAQYVDDCGSNKGCSFYVGQRGHKQLNIYEKGKQLGDPDSGHTRCELRLYAKRIDLPNDVLRNPGKYFAGSYPMLAAYVIGEAERLLTKEQMVNASAKAMVRFLRNQAGTALNLVMDALGDDALEFLMEHVVRDGRPGRMKNVVGDLPALVRAQLQTIPSQEAA
jgi:phage replication initiation protein